MIPFSRFAGYFLEVARQGSLRRAAEVLHVSASAIDRQILRAEQQFATPLFERLPAGLKLTAAGELLLHDLRRWGKEHIRTLERLDELKGLKRGHVKIALIEALGDGMLVRTVTDVEGDHPYLTFDLRVLENRQVSEQVSAAEVDFGLLLDPFESPSLEVRASATIPIGMAMRLDHPLADRSRVSLGDALAYRQLMPAAPLMVHEHARTLYARHRVDNTQIVACNNVRMMRSLIRNGAGIGILSLLDVASDLEERRLAFVPLHGRQVKPLTLALCVAPRRQLSRAAQLVMQRLALAMEKLGR
jgi:DNA-binding transcriptional LysR family regulator